jgi:hypothetical protein
MQQRTIIEAAPDGNILFTRQQLSAAASSGNSKQRRQAEREGIEPTWHKVDRAIWRPGKPLPEKAQDYPGVLKLACTGTAMALEIGAANDIVAALAVENAALLVQSMELQQADFQVQTPKEVRVRLEERVALGSGMYEWREV